MPGVTVALDTSACAARKAPYRPMKPMKRYGDRRVTSSVPNLNQESQAMTDQEQSGAVEESPIPTTEPADEVRRFTRYLKHDLSDEEILEMRLERESGDADIEVHQQELAELTVRTKATKAKIEAQQAVGAELSKDIRNGYQWRDVACWETEGELPDHIMSDHHPGTEGMITVRADDRSVVEWRPFRPDERQGDLFDGEAADEAEETTE